MRTFGLIGYPLSHSFSQKYFTEKFEKENIADAEYRLFSLENISGFNDLVKNIPGLIGLNVTIPHKESVIPLLDELDKTAKEVGAVNCILIKNGKTQGFNTDVIGFRQSLKPFLETRHERALILGTGGAAKAAAYVMKQIGIPFTFVSRKQREGVLSYSQLNREIIAAHPLIINASPCGMYPSINEAPALPYEHITEAHFLYDMVYNPEETLFLKKGKEKGALTLNGLSMLYEQAEEAWGLWNK